MRFAYIDSQGSEVEIPSVDALALRIELGAIGPDTELFDAQENRWGPAHTHEIFHSLQRDAEGEGFVAPPPPVAPPQRATDPEEPPATEPAAPEAEAPAEPTAPESPAPDEAPGADAQEEAPSFDLAGGLEFEDGPPTEEGAAEPGAPEPTEAEPAAAEGGGDDLDFGLTLTGGPAGGAEPAAESAAERSAADPPASGADDPFALDLAPAAGGATEPEPAGEPDAESGGFDFGDIGSLEFEGAAPATPDAPDEPEEAVAMDLGGPPAEEPMSFGAPDEPEEPDGAMEFGGAVQRGADLGADAEPTGDFGGGLELEQPMSEFTPDAPPAWMEQDGPSRQAGSGEAVMDLSEPSGDRDAPAAAEQEAEPRPKREPRTRPSPPRRPRRFPTKAVLGVLFVGGLGAGGWFGWPVLQEQLAARSEAQDAPARPPVVIPDIPAELLPQMRDIGEQALGDMIAEFRRLQGTLDLPVQPRDEWLAGVYLANASRYPDVEQYWLAVESFVDTVRALDAPTFHDRYAARAQRARVDAETAALLTERADSGFLAAMDTRFEAYAQMGDLINASLDLHQFLLDNEDIIDYEPAASGVSRDPLLEAVPADREVANQMGDHMGRIADALATLGTLDRVTTERLSAVLYDRLRRAGFQ